MVNGHQEEKELGNSNEGFQITDALFIAFVTFMGYLITRTYIASYYEYYNIPSIYIEINTSKILEVLSSIFSFFANYILYLIPLLLIPMPVLKSTLFNLTLRYIFYLVLFAVLTLYILSFSTLSIVLFSIMFILLTCFFFVKPAFDTEGSNYFEKVSNHYKNEKELGLLRFSFDYFKTRLGIYIVIIPFIVLLFPLAEYLGNKKAQEQTDYLILKSPQEMVLLDTYKGLSIVAPISIKERTIQSKFQLIEQKSDLKKPIQFELTKIGNLKIEAPKAEKAPKSSKGVLR